MCMLHGVVALKWILRDIERLCLQELLHLEDMELNCFDLQQTYSVATCDGGPTTWEGKEGK
jgi:hypothetical protein